MADSYQSPTYHLLNKLQSRLGQAGYSLHNYQNTALNQISGGAYYLQDARLWFHALIAVPQGGAVWWENNVNPGGVYCNQAGIFYIAQSQGGAFRLAISTNGGPWTTKLTLSGYSAAPAGRFTNVTLFPGRYRVRVETDTGTNYILGPHALRTQTNGLHAVFIETPGLGLDQVTNVPLSIRGPIIAALQPDLLVWHMKEDSSLSTSNRLEENEFWWRNSAPNCDVLYLGTTWVAMDTNSTWTPDQNSVVRNVALKHDRAYVDLMRPTISYPWLVTNGYMLDTTHLNYVGGLLCANIMWNDLGFFALGLSRKLSLTTSGTEMQLSYNTTNGAIYRLEYSTNLWNWSAILTNTVGNATFSTNVPRSVSPTYYRLGLSPN